MWEGPRGNVWAVVGLIVLVIGSIGACTPDSEGVKNAAGPGSSALKDEDSVKCTTDADCAAEETCAATVCQM